MSRFEDFHDATHDEARRDALALAALGEPLDPDLASHEHTCAVCRAELDGLRRTVDLARGGVAPAPAADVRPPDTVWAGIAAELGLGAPADPAPVAPTPATDDREPPVPPVASLDAGRGRHRRRRALLGAVAAVAVLGAGVGGYAIGHDGTPTDSCPTVTAALGPIDGSGGDARGTAEVVCSADGPALRVTTERLPIGSGFYEVWMYQPTSGAMVPVGTLGSGGSGTFTLPGGMDIRDYPVIDVSAQQYDAGPEHDRSVLQGPLTS